MTKHKGQQQICDVIERVRYIKAKTGSITTAWKNVELVQLLVYSKLAETKINK